MDRSTALYLTMKKIYTSKEAAELLGIKEPTVRYYAWKGILPSTKFADVYQFHYKDLAKYLKNKRKYTKK